MNRPIFLHFLILTGCLHSQKQSAKTIIYLMASCYLNFFLIYENTLPQNPSFAPFLPPPHVGLRQSNFPLV